VEVALGAKQYPTQMKIYLGPSPMGPGVQPYPPGTVLYVGTTITIRVGVYSPDEGKWISPLPQNVLIYRKIDAGAYERIWAGSWTATDTFDVSYKLAKAGTHTFYAEFPGTDVYAGCEETVHGLRVTGGSDYGASPEVSVEALPALTVIVKDMIMKKPVVGAKVVIDTTEAITDDLGMAVFEALTSGTYTLTVSARDYKSASRTIDFTTAGKVEEVHLLPMWAIAAGVVGAGSVGLVVAVKLSKR
jgi:hypothetical protein